jgi:hypothetical protein|tara:strand:+ start:526 stop:669 length:144 start_codon:yes stop_codon:yes gene_type:complete
MSALQAYISTLPLAFQVLVLTGWFWFQLVAFFGTFMGIAWIVRRFEK